MKKRNILIKTSALLLLVTTLASCNGLTYNNNARLALGGDPLTLETYKELVAPSYKAMASSSSFALEANNAIYGYTGDFEYLDSSNNVTSKSVDIDVSSFSYTSAYINATSLNKESIGGKLSVDLDGALSYDDGTNTYAYESGSHSFSAQYANGLISSDDDAYFIYKEMFSLPFFSTLFTFPELLSNLLFLSDSTYPIVTSDILSGCLNGLVASATNFMNLESSLQFNDEFIGAYSYGDDVYGLGIYMDGNDYTSILSSFKNAQILLYGEESYMNNYGHFLDKLSFNRLAMSIVNNAKGITTFGFNLKCELEEMDDYIYLSSNSAFKVSNLDVNIGVVFTLSQGDNALSVYESIEI